MGAVENSLGKIRRLFSFESAVTKLRSALSRLHAHNAHAISDRGGHYTMMDQLVAVMED